MMKNVQDENALRTQSLKKDISKENIIRDMNSSLSESHEYLINNILAGSDFPIIFSFGLPRSGTTLLMQLLTKYFDVGYVDNLIARFWDAPLFGINLSQELLSRRHNNFKSTYGKTHELESPHEFAYFWHKWFGINSIEGIELEKIKKYTDWKNLSRQLIGMAEMFGKPLVLKGFWPAYCMQEMINHIPKSYFVYLHRNPEEIAVSLYHARIAYYADPNIWWSMYPPEYKKLLNLDWPEQIAGQVYYLTKFYEEQFESLVAENYLTLDYSLLCANPRQELEKVREGIKKGMGVDLDKAYEVPGYFQEHIPFRDFDGVDALINSIRSHFYNT